ncbi:hypothetical protein [Spiroplasma citri]|uniref:Uncharacterized protein n=1 Tax=Spiroplasma citri TaxID=2133 RepID=A0AAJ4EI79_SPICI|nr:hypothetical protein [Spiroplasma citri]APE74205.1 hypothetical protein SCITRI_00294 [Spiroplasma citri]QED24175.1 hypothetical protein FRX96_01350 [Spiroplasma citri]QIA66442.1 hypothetical protein GMI18_01360 [Spiroplasma citri]QIA67101.1 hypothetical protein GMI18_05255 [Spiroplasma citri]QIA67268.1 hypothetical protein GMI18_06250 [Spiroplasma citri]
MAVIKKSLDCEMPDCKDKVLAKFKKDENGDLVRQMQGDWPVQLCINHFKEFQIKLKETMIYMANQDKEYKNMLDTMIVKKN